MRTVWIVNHYAHHRSRDGRSTRHQHLADGLALHGWHTVVIAADTDHPTGRSHMRGLRLRERSRGTGAEFCWFRGVDHRGGGLRRAVARTADVLVFTALLLVPGALRGLPRPDLVVGSSFHLLAAWAASVLARRAGVPFVFEPRDLWPESALALTTMGPGHPVVRVLRYLERIVVERSVHVVSPLDGVGRYYADRGLERPFTWIPNGVGCDRQDDGDPDEPDDGGTDRLPQPFTVTYIGSMGPANALDVVVDGFALAAARLATTGGPPIALRLVGDGADASALRRRVSSLPAGVDVAFTGRLPQEHARRVGRQADCLVLAMHDLPLYRHGVSMNKQYEYMLLGRPPLVAAPFPLAPVTAADCGVQVAPSPEALADGLLALVATPPAERAAMGRRGRAHVVREHDYRVLAGRLADVLDTVLARA